MPWNVESEGKPSGSSSQSRNMILLHDEGGSLSHIRLSRIGDVGIERERTSDILTKKTDYFDLEANRTAIGLSN